MYEIDIPIKINDEDILNRSKFVEILYDSIIDYGKNQDECLVIGLMGEWGCGKTSIINMLYEKLDEFNEKQKPGKQWINIKFNPWYFSNQNSILYHFFDFLMEEFNKTDKINKIFTDLSKFKDKLANFSLNASYMGTGFGISYDNPDVDSNIYKSFNSLKKDLMYLFYNLDYNIIISIDDIDRLSDQEMQQIFLLVKALADFPNVIYILSFDKHVALKALNNLQVYSPEKFLEKIIQIPINIPEITKSRLELLIENRLRPIYEDNLNFGKNDIEQVLFLIKPFFNNIRDLKRYTNVLNFYLNQFKNEINIGDFLLIIAIQVFEEDLYEKIKNNKDLLTNYNLLESLNEKNKNNIYTNFLNEITDLKKYDSEKIKDLMCYLFPILKNSDADSKRYYERMFGANLNIASDLHFDKYFTLSIEENEISQIIIDEILELRDIGKISKIMLNLINENKSVSLLNKLESNIYRIEMEDAHYFIEPLLLIGDNTRYMSKLYHLVDSLFNLQFDGNKSYTILKKMLINSDSFFTVCYCLDKIGDDYGLYYGTESKSKNLPYIEPDEFKELINIAYNRLNNWAYNGNLFKDVHFKYFLDFWKAWGTKKEVKNYIETFLNESNAIDFIKKFKLDNKLIIVDENEKFEEDLFDLERLYDYTHPGEIWGLVKQNLTQENISNDDYNLGEMFINKYEEGIC